MTCQKEDAAHGVAASLTTHLLHYRSDGHWALVTAAVRCSQGVCVGDGRLEARTTTAPQAAADGVFPTATIFVAPHKRQERSRNVSWPPKAQASTKCTTCLHIDSRSVGQRHNCCLRLCGCSCTHSTRPTAWPALAGAPLLMLRRVVLQDWKTKQIGSWSQKLPMRARPPPASRGYTSCTTCCCSRRDPATSFVVSYHTAFHSEAPQRAPLT